MIRRAARVTVANEAERDMRKRLSIFGAIATALLFVVLPVAAGDVLDDVLRMLDNDLDEALILDWLEQGDKMPAAIDADAMIELKAAGASDELVRRLMSLAGEAPATPAPTLPPAPSGTSEAGEVLLRITTVYRVLPPLDGDSRSVPLFDLFTYVDGQPLSWVPADETGYSRKMVNEIILKPGIRRVRVLQEHHKPNGETWRSESRVAADPLDLDLGSGLGWELRIEYVEPRWEFKTPHPLSWLLTRDGQRIGGAEKLGLPGADWSRLCDDIETWPEAQGKPPRWVRKALDQCVTWASLWPTVPDLPARAVVRDALAAQEFRPEPNARP